jgi:hydrogenase expression/formation protein HypC
MCLAVPGRIVEIRNDRQTLMATVDFDGIRKDVCLAYLPDAVVDDYVLVHVGFALSKVDEASALETLEMFSRLGTLEENLGAEPAAPPGRPPAPAGRPA